MRKLVLFLFTLSVFVAAADVKVDFAKAKLTKHAKIENGILICDVPSNEAKGFHGLIVPVNLKNFLNAYVVWTVSGQGWNLSRPAVRNSGHKFILVHSAADGRKLYAESNGKYGTFQKRKFSFGSMVENGKGEAVLRIGVENVSGRMEYDLKSFSAVVRYRKQNADHLCEYSDAVRNRPVRRGVMSPIVDQANEENFKLLKQWNVNLMRLQLNTSIAVARDPVRYREFIDGKIENVIPKVLDLGKKYGIYIILDLHTVPGTGNTRWNPCLFDDAELVAEFVRIWERIAKKFRNHPALYGYDLINEPNEQRPVKFSYWEVQRLAAEAIRKIDPETPIYLESNHLCSPYTYSYLSPLKLKNIIYEFHWYDPFLYTHTAYTSKDRAAGKKMASYPGIFYGAEWDFKSMRGRLFRSVRAFQEKHRARIFVGEFSARASAPGAERYLKDCIRVFEEFGWDWTYHAFRESKTWSLEYEGPTDDTLVPSRDNLRKRVLLEGFRKNRRGTL